MKTRWEFVIGVVLLGLAALVLPRVLPQLKARTERAEPVIQATFVMYPERDPVVREFGLSEPAMGRFRDAQVQFLKSRTVLQSALRDRIAANQPIIQQQQDALDWLSRQLRVEMEGNFLRVSLGAGNRAEQAAVVNAIATAYVQDIVGNEATAKRARFERLKNQYLALQTILHEKTLQIVSLQKVLGAGAVAQSDQRRTLALEQLRECATRRLEARLQKVEAEVRLRRIKETAEEPETKDTNLVEERIAVLVAQEEALNAETARLERLLEEETKPPNSSDLARLQQDISSSTTVMRFIGDEIARLSISLDDPPSVQLFEKAEGG